MYGIRIDQRISESAMKQICGQLRGMIESGALTPGTRLLPTRQLAKEWGIARNIVIEVYEQLTAEGYLEGRVGSGTYVADGIRISDDRGSRPPEMHARPIPPLPEAGSEIIDFATGIPDGPSFPGKTWAKYMKEAAVHPADRSPGYGSIFGNEQLRREIQDYLFRAKGIRCETERIIIVSGASEGMLLAAAALQPRYRAVYVEDPTIPFARDIFKHMQYRIVPLPVDRAGMNFDLLNGFRPGHLALVTPSHQFPVGSLLSIQRRKRAIRMAEEADAYLLEDDYDSEFRLKGMPVPPLHTLAPDRVLYIGTFSKTLSPGLRIGFVLVPPSLIDSFGATKEALNLFTPPAAQQALAGFMADGHYERHILAMKKLYKKRRQALIDALHRYFGQSVAIDGDEAGMHLRVAFRHELLSTLPWEKTETFGFKAETCREYAISNMHAQDGIVLGYGNLSIPMIDEGVRRLQDYAAAHGYCSV
ncbi:PLP-dependent aminotransferase family protein [Paenibacillus methanolicus]|uniref:GntR family transcriptional regulator/MocR family aminotransferase n=1 Tax=Paenibacillus methanolicus TaxID=582686 RepID=A0A5S5CJ61_9BACL|nr:PLP-dependent aminotransferase family protein [Paenibacillus methanolicus]TYP79053.1 GntR family transcriptional regulator/MocR family aminotransferase [Paenibacillus methanolicus]